MHFLLLLLSLFFTPKMIDSHLSSYTTEEVELIKKDLEVVRSITFKEGEPKEKPLYLATAGGPGARKTTILERFMASHPEMCSQMAYLDPDQRALKFMAHTYYSRSLCASEIAKYPIHLAAAKAAYEKWRGGSNFITLTLLEEAFAQKRDIAHGTTSTGEIVGTLLSKIKEAGYHITLLLCSCEDDLRVHSIQYRNEEQKFYQSTPEDAVTKGKFFPLRMPIYFKYADTLYLYWSDNLSTQERLAAIIQDKKIQILDAEAYILFVNKYERDRKEQNLPSWHTLF